MKTWKKTVVLAVLLALVVSPALAGPPGYLGKYQVGDTIVFSWAVDLPSSPLWSLYEINDDGSYRGMLRCFGCFTEVTPGTWESYVGGDHSGPANVGNYMICADDGVWQSGIFNTWTFRIGGKGGKPIKTPTDLTECP